MRRLTLLILFITTLFICFSCKNEPATEAGGDQLGEIHITFTGSEAALPHFEKGLKLLHNFEYDDARGAFLKAQETDSTCVMAYWGEAMTYNHPLWRSQDYEEGQAALAKLATSTEERLALAQTDLEKDFLQCMEIMYGEAGNKKERDSMYSTQLERMYKKYPGNEEVAAFYALSILGAVKVGRDEEAYETGAAVAQGILKENPNHPGALHYLIHSYDDPSHAPKALPAAFSYSKVAADATHALHMPSHIFVAVGMWDEVIKSNIASWEASVRQANQEEEPTKAGSYHALHWLMYGLLQKGKTEEAKKLVTDMNTYATDMPSKRSRGYLFAMKGNYLGETDDWTSEVADFTADMDDLNVATQAKALSLEGMKYYHQGNADSLASIIAQIKEKRKSAANLVSEEGIPMCAAPGANRSAPNQADIDQAHIMEMELQGMYAMFTNDDAQAENWFKQAAELESNTSYSYGPPDIVIPSYELYGNWLLEHNRTEEAALQFDQALKKGPKRRRALQGRLKATIQMQDEEKVKEIEGVLEEISGTINYEL